MTGQEGTQVRKRRRRRGRRGRGNASGPEAAPARSVGSKATAPAEWQWRTFPVFLSFMVGMLVMATAVQLDLGEIVYIAALGGVAYGLAHMLTRWFVTRRRR